MGALWVTPRPALTRQALLLIERLAYEQGRSLWLARKTKEALAAAGTTEVTDEQREEQRQADPHEFYGFTQELAAMWEARMQAEVLRHTYISAHTPAGKELPVFTPPWRPGLPHTTQQSAGNLIDLDDPGFNPASLLT